jgi:hypothetical protein
VPSAINFLEIFMSNAPQSKNTKDQCSSQGKPAQAGNDIKKGEDRMKNEGGSCSTSSKPSQGNPKSSNA